MWQALNITRYLAEDLSTTYLEGRRILTGYEAYIVEQWACSRVHPTFVITTYTGLPQHKVHVGVLSVPIDESTWSPRLRVYLRAISQLHARKKETPLGTIMITDLSGLPSALTVIAVPSGDTRAHREDFILNENLKRLGCSGRAGLNLSVPTGATQAKFYQLYHISDRVLLQSAVIELVRLCQIALVMFNKLAPEYADGLLCDVTERAVNEWWIKIGMEYFNAEPSDESLGPSTVAALLGLLLGARNRLSAYGAPVNKDVFDIKATKRSIDYFQKSQKIARTRRLDRETLRRLHRVTSKTANNEGWTVPRAVKSTVAELSGKGGEMVMGIVGARDKPGITEVETLDIAAFAQAVSGGHCRWLWQGKPRKSPSGDLFTNLARDDEMVFSTDETGGYIWSSRPRDSLADQGRSGPSHLDHLYMHGSQGSQASLETTDRELAFRKAVLKSVTGRMSDARSGLGRFKEAVSLPGLRGHQHKYSKDINNVSGHDRPKLLYTADDGAQTDVETPPQSPNDELDSQIVSHDSYGSGGIDEQQRIWLLHGLDATAMTGRSLREGWTKSFNGEVARRSNILPEFGSNVESLDNVSSTEEKSHRPRVEGTGLSASTPTGEDPLIHKVFDAYPSCLWQESRGSIIRSSQSFTCAFSNDISHDFQERWPRRLSFSVIDGTLSPHGILQEIESASNLEATTVLSREQYSSLVIERRMAQMRKLEVQDAPWAARNLQFVEMLAESASTDLDELQILYGHRFEDQNSLQEAISNLVTEEKLSITESLKEFEVLNAKLEYEFGALQTRIGDVEDSVADFDRQVSDLEVRACDLEDGDVCKDSWFYGVTKFFTGSK